MVDIKDISLIGRHNASGGATFAKKRLVGVANLAGLGGRHADATRVEPGTAPVTLHHYITVRVRLPAKAIHLCFGCSRAHWADIRCVIQSEDSLYTAVRQPQASGVIPTVTLRTFHHDAALLWL